MTFVFCFSKPQTFSRKIDRSASVTRPSFNRNFTVGLKHANKELIGGENSVTGSKESVGWSFIGGEKIITSSDFPRLPLGRKSSGVYVSCLASSEAVTNTFTLGTAAVLPFYVLMVAAPKSDLTKKLMESNVPYVVLGLVYAHLLCSSWTHETMKLLFTSKYMLPELPGIAQMFSSETTLASVWIHLLTIDLYAARHVFRDGVRNDIETRHSVILCLFFCPIGIVTHVITRLLQGKTFKREP